MEGRFRRYLNMRRLYSEPSQARTHSLDDIDAHSIAYEATSPAKKPPIFLSQSLRKSIIARRAKDDSDGLAIRAFSYESVRAGKPPIRGGKPFKGNGPVKLQTSRRLSSGELLTTTQDHQRTLEDIREGGYIVGGKEKRHSQISHRRTSSPMLNGPISPRAATAPSFGKSRASISPVQSRNISSPTQLPANVMASPIIPESSTVDNSTDTHENHELDQPSQSTQHNDPISETTPNIVSLGNLIAASPEAQLGPTSLLTQGEEQNATIQALWKAEYSRLVAIYGQEGVDRNIADLNRDQRTRSLMDYANMDLIPSTLPNLSFEPLLKPPLDGARLSNSGRNSRGSLTRNSSTFDDISDQSSNPPSSILSAGESSSYTKRTSIIETDSHTTREDIHRIVEGMRSTYLKAIELKSSQTPGSKRNRKSKLRASMPETGSSRRVASPLKAIRPHPKSWHASSAPTKVKIMKDMKEEETNLQAPSPVVRSSPSKSSVKSKSSLQRADSLTLGAFFSPTTGSKHPIKDSSSISITSVTQPRAVEKSPAQLVESSQTQVLQSPNNNKAGFASSVQFESEPEIDDFDIFYQDLYVPATSSSFSVEPVHPMEGLSAQGYQDVDEVAPPPPDITWTPRRRILETL